MNLPNLLNLFSLLSQSAFATTPTAGTQCFVGTIVTIPTGLIGATTGFLIVQNTVVPIRQVPGPTISGVPIAQLDLRTARVCGNFVQDVSDLTFNVTLAIPLPTGAGAATGLGAAVGTGLGASRSSSGAQPAARLGVLAGSYPQWALDAPASAVSNGAWSESTLRIPHVAPPHAQKPCLM